MAYSHRDLFSVCFVIEISSQMNAAQHILWNKAEVVKVARQEGIYLFPYI